MSHPEYTEDELDALALYALGLLEAEERSKWDEHLRQGCVDCELHLAKLNATVACAVAYGAPVVDPPVTLRRRVLAAIGTPETPPPPVQIGKHWNPRGLDEIHVVRSDGGDWNEIQPGISVKKLYVDHQRDTVTMLIRMSPGTSYGRHLHAGPEQCFVLEGDLWEGETVVTSGDYQCLPTGSIHERQMTRSGCLLLIVSSLHDQPLE